MWRMLDNYIRRRGPDNQEAHFDEVYLKSCHDGDSAEYIRDLIDTATNFDRKTVPYAKEASCAVM